MFGLLAGLKSIGPIQSTTESRTGALSVGTGDFYAAPPQHINAMLLYGGGAVVLIALGAMILGRRK